MGLFSNLSNLAGGSIDLLTPGLGSASSGRDIFSVLFDPGDITNTQSSKAKKEERKKIKEIEQKRERLQSSRQAGEQIRKAIIARSQIVAAGEQQGVGGSSGVVGGAGSVLSQAGGNLSFINQLQSFNQQSRKRITNIENISGDEQQTREFVGIATTFFGGI